MNATELVDGLAALPGTKDAGAADGIAASRLVNGVEYAVTAAVDERKLRAAWKRRRGGGAVPLLLISDDPKEEGRLRVLGPQADGPVRAVRAETLLELVSRTVGLKKLDAIRLVAEEVERRDTEGVAGVAVRGLGTEHLYGTRLPNSDRWPELAELVAGIPTSGWCEALEGLGYSVKGLPRRGYLASAGSAPVIVIHPRRSAQQFARLDDAGRLPEEALVADCLAHGAPYGMLAAGSRMRLLRVGRDDSGAATRYLELDVGALEADKMPLAGLLAPPYLAEGRFDDLLREAQDYGGELRLRLDRALRQEVLPVLERELGRWAEEAGRDVADDGTRADLEAAVLTFAAGRSSTACPTGGTSSPRYAPPSRRRRRGSASTTSGTRVRAC